MSTRGRVLLRSIVAGVRFGLNISALGLLVLCATFVHNQHIINDAPIALLGGAW